MTSFERGFGQLLEVVSSFGCISFFGGLVIKLRHFHYPLLSLHLPHAGSSAELADHTTPSGHYQITGH